MHFLMITSVVRQMTPKGPPGHPFGLTSLFPSCTIVLSIRKCICGVRILNYLHRTPTMHGDGDRVAEIIDNTMIVLIVFIMLIVLM